MTTPWPDDVLDCAKRLAKSLGYEDSQIRVVEGRVMIYRAEDESYHGRDGIYWYWHPLDPLDPTVWSALLGKDRVRSLRCYRETGNYAAEVYLSRYYPQHHSNKHPGIAVCEAYNALKGNSRLEVSV